MPAGPLPTTTTCGAVAAGVENVGGVVRSGGGGDSPTDQASTTRRHRRWRGRASNDIRRSRTSDSTSGAQPSAPATAARSASPATAGGSGEGGRSSTTSRGTAAILAPAAASCERREGSRPCTRPGDRDVAACAGIAQVSAARSRPGLSIKPDRALGCVALAVASLRDRGTRPPAEEHRAARRDGGAGRRERHATSAEFAVGLFLTTIALGVAAAGRLGLGALLLACGATIVVWAYLQRRAEGARLASLLAGQTRILEMVATGSSLGEVLDALCRLIENQVPGLICSVLLLEGDRLRDQVGIASCREREESAVRAESGKHK